MAMTPEDESGPDSRISTTKSNTKIWKKGDNGSPKKYVPKSFILKKKHSASSDRVTPAPKVTKLLALVIKS